MKTTDLHSTEQSKKLKQKPLRIAIVAGEMSGDLLGSNLINAIKAQNSNVEFFGVGGPKMIETGCRSLFPMERLSVMGVVEVLGRLPELLGIRKSLFNYFSQQPPDLFIGIDAPDFNLPLALKLRKKGITTAHYVSPSVWAWRQKRVFKIKEAVDLMLTLLPFEASFYQEHNVPVQFVGHPLADLIDINLDTALAKEHWGHTKDDQIVAVLPGSRGGELKHMGPLFIDVMHRCFRLNPQLKFMVPLANAARKSQFEDQLTQSGYELPVQLVDGHAREVMAGSDAVLVTSGTATLEAMLLKRPMVVAYKWGRITHAIISRLVNTAYISLPNLLADEALVPEFIQEQACPDALAKSLLAQLREERQTCLHQKFTELHQQLACNASQKAANALLSLINAVPE